MNRISGLLRWWSSAGSRRDASHRGGRLGAALALCVVFSTGASMPQPVEEYRVGPRDQLEVMVFAQADLSGLFTVGTDGGMSFPLIGDVRVGGLTTREIQTEITRRLADGYLRNPQVSVRVAEYRSQRVFVMGEVGLPGAVVLTGSMTLLEAVAQAGGLGRDAGTELVVLRRSGGDAVAAGPLLPGQAGASEIARIGLDDLQSGRFRENVALQDGDTILVPRAEEVFVLGQVKTPGPIPYSRDLTVFKALSLAGGVTELASTRRMRIVRIVDGEKREIKAEMTDQLAPGDTLMVPTRWF